MVSARRNPKDFGLEEEISCRRGNLGRTSFGLRRSVRNFGVLWRRVLNLGVEEILL